MTCKKLIGLCVTSVIAAGCGNGLGGDGDNQLLVTDSQTTTVNNGVIMGDGGGIVSREYGASSQVTMPDGTPLTALDGTPVTLPDTLLLSDPEELNRRLSEFTINAQGSTNDLNTSGLNSLNKGLSEISLPSATLLPQQGVNWNQYLRSGGTLPSIPSLVDPNSLAVRNPNSTTPATLNAPNPPATNGVTTPATYPAATPAGSNAQSATSAPTVPAVTPSTGMTALCREVTAALDTNVIVVSDPAGLPVILNDAVAAFPASLRDDVELMAQRIPSLYVSLLNPANWVGGTLAAVDLLDGDLNAAVTNVMAYLQTIMPEGEALHAYNIRFNVNELSNILGNAAQNLSSLGMIPGIISSISNSSVELARYLENTCDVNLGV